MRLTISKNDILRALTQVLNVVEKKHSINILTNVKITANRAHNSEIVFAGTDMDVTIVSHIPAMINQDGETTAPAHTLFDIIKKLPDGSDVALNLKEADGKLEIHSDRSRFALQTISSDEFPHVQNEEMPVQFSIPREDLKKLIERTRFAISTEETRYYLNGIFLHTVEEEGGRLTAVATDGHRLAKSSVVAPEGSADLNGIIIPRKAVEEVLKLLDGAGELIEVAVSETKIRFDFGNTRLTSKLIDGKFPDYSRVIPKNNDKTLIVSRMDFQQAVDRVSTISSEKMRAVKVSISKNLLHFSVNSVDKGSAEEEIYGEYNNEPLNISFNFRYLLDIARQIESGRMEILMSDATSPVIMRDGGDQYSLFVVMPLRV